MRYRSVILFREIPFSLLQLNLLYPLTDAKMTIFASGFSQWADKLIYAIIKVHKFNLDSKCIVGPEISIKKIARG
jgi:hypothetical protein